VRYLVVLALALTARAAGAQDLTCGAGDLEVVGLSFSGNVAFSSATLASGIVTTPSSWSRRTLRFFGKRRCLDRRQFPLDVVRLLIWYRNHGYSSATVDTVVSARGPGRVSIRFAINEGLPMLVDSLVFAGLDAVAERAELVEGLATRLGAPFDRYANEQTRDSLTKRLRDGGYPDAEVFVGYDTRIAARRAAVMFTVAPGPRVRVGEVVVEVTPREGAARSVSDRAVRRAAGVHPGDLYSERDLERAKRALYQTEAFTRVLVAPDSALSPGDSTVAVHLAVTEGFMRAARVGAGYGTLDCFRTTGDLTQYNFLGGATRLDLRARVSKIGIGKPVTGLADLCPQANRDLYSRDLNYYAGAAVTQPPVFKEFSPSYALYSERRSEYNAFLRTTPVGGSVALSRPLGRLTQSLAYTVEFGRTEAQPALLCAVFNACVDSDRVGFERTQRLGVVSLSMMRETGDNPVNPSRGSVLKMELRSAGAYTGSDARLRFSKMLVDGAVYAPSGRDVVLAARIRVGAVVGPSLSFSNAALFVPPQERLFAGGPTTVRGFRQNELGPAVYIPSAYDTVHFDGSRAILAHPGDTVYFRARADSGVLRIVPTGGNALIVANLEARMRSPLFPDLMQWTAFADVGEVWNRGTEGGSLGFKSLRWTPGMGVRVPTVIGFVRADLAYNPYERAAGAAYFDAPLAAGGALFCVSPGNDLPVTLTTEGKVSQGPGSCRSSFQPPRASGFFRRMTLSISIGQAF